MDLGLQPIDPGRPDLPPTLSVDITHCLSEACAAE
ncbi:hypothetical protein BJ997_000712 [Cryobacterium roopkundense]|uniref:Uncharacterized protein n=1 Tax=Cryobacterium roopkundense TaxID=1001240 RepID=A0A7W9E3A4_9MICO|nr:hypothetical protein [Cryobacterium roopkundense]